MYTAGCVSESSLPRRRTGNLCSGRDTHLASYTGPVTACGASSPNFCSYHGTQTETGNHGRVGSGPKYTGLVYGPQLARRVGEQAIYFPERILQPRMGLFFQDSLHFMELISKF